MNSAEVRLKQFKLTVKKYGMNLFSQRFYKYLKKYMKLIVQKKQLTRIL